MLTDFDAVTFLWATANVTEVAPAGIVTEAGTVAAAVLELVSFTTKPAAGAGPEMVKLPTTGVEELPTTLDGLTVMEVSNGKGRIVSEACCELLK